ncbi:MAG TPA: 7-cyano-7-deazaguanine synthase QueC [Fimbriimonadaceae bacterium]|nr:7-cyano-7-deazaguanine synthase QueC [Fimbriimonadaceae bacterium]
MSASKAVVLLSGGLDSATCLAVAKSRGLACYCMGFLYGQRHAYEHECAKRVADSLGAEEFRTVTIDLRAFGGSALTDEIEVPKVGVGEGIPPTYVPARNTVFLSYALAWAEVLGASSIYIGVNAQDYSGYPDCRLEFIETYQKMADLATKAGIEGRGPKIETPLIDKTKAEIISLGLSLGVDYSLTSSCYDPSPDGRPCGECDSCRLRSKGFTELGIVDPLVR